MGAVNFSIDKVFVAHLKHTLPLSIFVETGTFEGESIDQIGDLFDILYTTELSSEYYLKATHRFQNNPSVKIYNDSSDQFLQNLSALLKDKSVLYWLDAHWCVATNTAGEQSQCPLLEELKAIASLNAESLILIDDARLFLCTPPTPHQVTQWPSFNDVLKELFALSSSHEVMVLNDVIVYYPSNVRQSLQQYAHNHSIDWLNALEKVRYYEQLMPQLTEKEGAIQEKESAIQEKELMIQQQAIALQEKQKGIEELADAANERLQIIQEQQQKIAQHEYALEQLKRKQKEEIQSLRQSKNLRIRKVTTTAKEQRQVISEQSEEIEILRRSLESTVDRRVRRRISRFSQLFN